jgi:hypothetical protein
VEFLMRLVLAPRLSHSPAATLRVLHDMKDVHCQPITMAEGFSNCSLPLVLDDTNETWKQASIVGAVSVLSPTFQTLARTSL